MKIVISITAFSVLLLQVIAQQSDYSQQRSDAEAAYAQGSYSRANEIYTRVDQSKLASADARWVNFRLADTSWRAQAATETSDSTRFEQAQKQLEELIRVIDKEENRDPVWAEAHESLGDLLWTRRNQMNWGGAWPHYQQALDWWAGQSDLTRARDRYLKIVFKCAEPFRSNDSYFYTYYGNALPLDVLENALKISSTANDHAHLHYLIAMTMRYSGGDWESRERVPDEFEEALKAGKQSDWYDDALFYYAEWMNSYGSIRQTEPGQWQQEPDYVKAIQLYRRLTTEFVKGETRYYDQAQQQIKNITMPAIGVGVGNVFLPGSELQFGLNARNVKRIDFALYRIDLTRDVRFRSASDDDEGDAEDGSWMQKLQIGGRPPVKAWAKDLNDKGDHKPYNDMARIEGTLPVGAYLLEAKSGAISA